MRDGRGVDEISRFGWAGEDSIKPARCGSDSVRSSVVDAPELEDESGGEASCFVMMVVPMLLGLAPPTRSLISISDIECEDGIWESDGTASIGGRSAVEGGSIKVEGGITCAFLVLSGVV